ncbi:MAG: flagellar biosynthesis protein FlhB [Rhodobacterales bacterium 17-64-5]|nr:MAG: flagellar biosynthesis protein FlhB [Rhodobacterales bacterium 12-65-15]OZA12752.1 MAG: flagellar biosynthesis protein FlhB [Rhodobacterales bacterium 17-64-5]
MSGEDDEESDKEHDASAQKLAEARKNGDIPRSADLLMAAGIAGLLLALVSLGGWAVQKLGTAGMVLLDQADRLAPLLTSGTGAPLGGLLLAFTGPTVAILLLPAAAVVAVVIATNSFTVTLSNLAPKLSRISPLQTAAHKFGPDGLVEFLKSAVKLCLVSTVLFVFLSARIEDILATMYLGPAPSTAVLAGLTIEFLFILLVIATVLGGVDYLWQVARHRQRNRMSRKEVMDEFKESEGDPHLKSARRQRAQEVATNRMLADVKTADVVVVNPTHYAVALRWDRLKGGAPVCVAKGVDELARVIRARAAEHGVPVHSNPPTARAIFASVEVGQEIRAEHYRAVAAAIRFAEAMRKKARQR